MIHKIERITSVGKFRNYVASGDVSFRKLTLIYADNGSGKTTLASIFRSLGSNSPSSLVGRTSTNSTAPQSAQIRQRDSSGADIYNTLRTAGWSNSIPEIEVFDIHFINNNVHSGFEITDDHKKKLHQFVIGAQGVGIQRQIETNKSNKSTTRQLISELENQIIQEVGNGLEIANLSTFLSLEPTAAEDIDNRITVAETELSNSRANALIQTLNLFEELTPLLHPFIYDETITDLETDLGIIDNEVLATIYKEHFEDLHSNNMLQPENWIKQGFEYYESVRNQLNSSETETNVECPFCKQSINDSLDIIKSYSLKFNLTLNQLIERLQAKKQTLGNYNIEMRTENLAKSIASNTGLSDTWRNHIQLEELTDQISQRLDSFKENFKNINDTINEKCGNPSAAIESLNVQTFRENVNEINELIGTYNVVVGNNNNNIRTLKASIKSVSQAETELSELNRIKKRFEPTTLTLCSDQATQKSNLRTYDRTYTQLVEQQETTANTFFTTYGTRINHYLSAIFRTPFQITNVEHIRPLGRATISKISYQLTIDNLPISFDNDQSLCIKDCLSEGDKSTIALSFFLAKLDIETNINNKIIIFDDPLSSLDSNRRYHTVLQLRNLLARVEQLIVLSHNDHFLFDLYKEIPAGERKSLRLTENFTDNSSMIESLDLETLVEIDYYKHIKELEEFLRHSDISQKERILGLLRNVLEAHIQFKFYRQIVGIPQNSRTFGNLITELVNQNVVFRDNANATDIIEKLRLINAISCKPHHGEPIPDYTTIGVDPATISVPELVGFVRDALSLIDDRI